MEFLHISDYITFILYGFVLFFFHLFYLGTEDIMIIANIMFTITEVFLLLKLKNNLYKHRLKIKAKEQKYIEEELNKMNNQ